MVQEHPRVFSRLDGRPSSPYRLVLLHVAEIELLQFEALQLNPLSIDKAQLVALHFKRAQLRRYMQALRKWPPEVLGDEFRLEDPLHMFLQRIGLMLAKLQRHEELIRFVGFLAIIWQKLLKPLLFSHNVSGFPNNHRPPCTTMPWNIRPALVVLWGVCWMFNPWSPIDDIQLQPLSAGEQTLFSSGMAFPGSNVHFVQLTVPTQISTVN